MSQQGMLGNERHQTPQNTAARTCVVRTEHFTKPAAASNRSAVNTAGMAAETVDDEPSDGTSSVRTASKHSGAADDASALSSCRRPRGDSDFGCRFDFFFFFLFFVFWFLLPLLQVIL